MWSEYMTLAFEPLLAGSLISVILLSHLDL